MLTIAVYKKMTHIYNHPLSYYHGSAPANVSGYINHCNANGSDCRRQASEASYMWFDELHPSQRTDEILAQSFIDVVRGQSRWARYW